jgi:hypothetical protein
MNELAIEAAKAVVPFLASYLAAATKASAKKFGEEGALAGIKLFGWLHEKLTGNAKQALDKFEKDPLSDDNKTNFHAQLSKFLDDHPQLLNEFRERFVSKILLERGLSQRVGDNSKAGINVGTGNSIIIK